MFKKLKERIESVDEIGIPKRPPGLAVRSPPADSADKSITDDLPSPENTHQLVQSPEQPSAKEDSDEDQDGGGESGEVVATTGAEGSKATTTELESVLVQLSSELSTLREQYDTLATESEKKQEELRAEVIHLEAQLDQKSESYTGMEGKIAELNWTVDNLTSRLQLYSSHDENETVQKLQNEVSVLKKNERERTLEIELLETRISALTRKRRDEQTTDTKTIRKLQEAIATLQKELNDSGEETTRLTEDHKLQTKLLSDVTKEKDQAESLAEEQKRKITKLEKEISELKLTHAFETELANEQHQRTVCELEEKLKDYQTKLKDKEEQLKRIVTELPDQPITKAVLDGYSRTKMVTSFSNTIVAPGAVLKRDTEPVVINDKDEEEEEEPAILPVENNVTIDSGYEFSHTSQAMLLDEIRTLRSENEQLSEEAINKDQTIRVQQQKISDMRKVLSKGLNKPQDPPPQPPPSLSANPEPAAPVNRLAIASEVNFQYLKNVVVRFICSREEEASQLLRAISTLLELTQEEEKYIRDYLQYKVSWFGTMPAPLKISIRD